MHMQIQISLLHLAWLAGGLACGLGPKLLAQSHKTDSYLSLAYQKAQAGNYRQALRYYDKALETDPQHAEAYYHRGNVRYDLKDYQGAIEDCQAALRLNPGLIDAFFNLGISHYHLKEYAEAITALSQALQANAQDGESYYWRGMAFFRINKINLACQDWNQAKNLGNAYVNTYLSRYCQEEGQIDSGAPE
ncbi:MAG: tetratricopeptide repeat protein [Microscillaceae bacterium]|nr:tetratricopeptide repeat protein [Microscillaceae bacterium]